MGHTKHARRSVGIACAAFILTSTSAFATNGYLPHGYGMKAKGMGGASAALAEDAMGGANNPASMAFVGDRADVGAEWFRPVRSAERSGAGFATLNGRVDSGRENFLIPEFGYNRMVNPNLSLGVTVYGNGGMNTSYQRGNFNCGAGPANILCGGGSIGVDLSQLIVAPTLAYKVNADHAIGISPLLAFQRFKAEGLQAFDNAPGFPPFTSAPGNVTNRDYANSNGYGVRVGWQGKITPALSFGAAYSSRVRMSRFDRYRGLFAERGDFDMPETWVVGVAFKPSADLTLALDWQHIGYSAIASVGNPSAAAAPLGAANGPGFGWRDVEVIKIGAQWRMSEQLTLRAGYNHGSNPVSAKDVTFNILAPGVVQDHFTAGATWNLSKASEVTAAFMVAPRKTVSGPSLFNAVLGPGAGGTETIGMRQMSLGLTWGYRF